jgi:hypothetical protein
MLQSLLDIMQGLEPGELSAGSMETTNTLLRLLSSVSLSTPKLAALCISVRKQFTAGLISSWL